MVWWAWRGGPWLELLWWEPWLLGGSKKEMDMKYGWRVRERRTTIRDNLSSRLV